MFVSHIEGINAFRIINRLRSLNCRVSFAAMGKIQKVARQVPSDFHLHDKTPTATPFLRDPIFAGKSRHNGTIYHVFGVTWKLSWTRHNQATLIIDQTIVDVMSFHATAFYHVLHLFSYISIHFGITSNEPHKFNFAPQLPYPCINGGSLNRIALHSDWVIVAIFH